MENLSINHPNQSFDLKYHHRHLSRIMSVFMQTNRLDECLNAMLEYYLEVFGGDRVYIFAYNEDYTSQDCLYELAIHPDLVEIDNLQGVSVDVTPWWTEQILSDTPIYVASLDQLPSEAASEQHILAAQGITSIMVVPMHVHGRVWGYMGVDLVYGAREWTERDVRKLDSVANTISLCIEFNKIREKEHREYLYLNNLLHYLPMAYKRMEMVTDEEGNLCDYIIVDANESFMTLKGWNSDETIGRKASELYQDTLAHLEYYDSVWTGKQESNEFVHYEREIDKFIQWVVYSPMPGEMVGLGVDITLTKQNEQRLKKAMEEAEESNRLKSAFLANISHEIRTPLHVIMGFSDIIAECEEREERQEYASVMKRNSETLNRLMSDLLDLSKIEAGAVTFHMTELEAGTLCRDVAASLFGRVKEGVSLELELPESECIIRSDSSRLQQVLVNFLTNAIKFTSKGYIRLGYGCPDLHHIRFYVSDTGIGIPEEDCPKVFNRFVKLSNLSEGTGLGLPISRGIIHQLGGEIGVESRMGEGACFWFRIPIRCKG